MKKMLKLLAVAVFLLTPVLLVQGAHAKEIAVLLPLTGPLTPLEKAELTKQVVDGLSSKFDLRHGEEVDSVVKLAFQDESKKQDCDETNCYRKIAAKYQAEKIVAIRVAVVEKERYLVTCHLYDVASGDIEDSQKRECAQCSLEKLKLICKELSRSMIK